MHLVLCLFFFFFFFNDTATTEIYTLSLHDALPICSFRLEGQEFAALNGGPQFKFTEAISLVVDCDSQKEVDDLWAKLSKGGAPGQCGWLKDKFGLSWQIVPRVMIELLQDKDPVKSQRVMRAMMQMTKIDIAGLQRAYRTGDPKK